MGELSDEGWFKKGQVKIAARRNPNRWAKPNSKGTLVPVGTGGEDPSSGEDYLLASKDEHEETDDKADDEAIAAAGRGTDDMVQPRPALALSWNPRGSPPPKFVMPNQPGNRAARGLTTLHNKPDGNPKIVRDDHEGPSVGASATGMKRKAAEGWEAHEQRMAASHGMESDEEANFKANPPQVLTALFGSTAVFGSTTGGNTQGKTGQGVSAAVFLPATTAGGNYQGQTGQGVSTANFFPKGHQYEQEAGAHGVSTRGHQNDKEAGAHDVRESSAGGATNRSSDEDSYNMADTSFGYVADANLKAMRDLADNRSIRGTSASRMAADARSAAAAPGWTGVDADDAAWLRDLWEDPTNPDAAITDGAPEWAYLVVINRGAHMLVIHHLFRWKARDGGHSHLDGRIVAFKGEVLDAHGLPRLWRFAKEEEKLLQLRPLLAKILEYAAMFYLDGDRDDEFHNCQTPPLGGRGATVQTCQHLIPIPVGWAHMFLDYPPMGVVYRRLLQLVSATADTADRCHFRAFGEGVALACGSPGPTAPNTFSAADSS